MKSPTEPYYAVIFTSIRTEGQSSEYEQASERMLALAKEQPGYIGFETARGEDGLGITVSYWKDMESIRSWKMNREHLVAQKSGKETWYEKYRVRICRVEREY